MGCARRTVTVGGVGRRGAEVIAFFGCVGTDSVFNGITEVASFGSTSGFYNSSSISTTDSWNRVEYSFTIASN